MDVDDDIQFDFFEDDPATTEAPPSRVRLRRPSGPRRRVGRPRGAGPLLRLLLLVAFVVFLVLVFGLLIQSCASAAVGMRSGLRCARWKSFPTEPLR